MQSRHKCKENGRRSNSGGGVGPGPARSKRPPPLPSFAPPRRRCNAITSGVGGVARSPPFPQSSVRPIRPSISSDSDGESSERAVARVVGSFRGREGRWKSKDRGLSLSLSLRGEGEGEDGNSPEYFKGGENKRTAPSQRYVEAFAFFIFGNHGMSDRRTDCSFVRRPAK